MFEIVFVDRETGRVNYAVTQITTICYITADEVVVRVNDRIRRSVAFPKTEKLEINRI